MSKDAVQIRILDPYDNYIDTVQRILHQSYYYAPEKNGDPIRKRGYTWATYKGYRYEVIGSFDGDFMYVRSAK